MNAKPTCPSHLGSMALLALLASLLPPSSALAGSPGALADKFFAAVKSVAPDPDEVELARYFVYEPAHAEPVYSKASSQDYVFIGILVAGKAARNQKFPEIGVFNYDACMTPINAFNAVFAKSGEFINKYGQEEHLKAYAQAENKEAKNEASAKLSEYIPYWEDIPHICHFTFFTNLQREKDMKNTFSARVGTMKKAYEDFADGNIVGGVDKLIAVGINGKVACTLADDIIGGGLIGKTPVLGNIAKEACAGFAGKVIGTVTDIAGYVPGQMMRGVNDLGDTLAGQTKNMPQEQYYQIYWAPRVGEGAAQGRAGNWSNFIQSIWNPCVSYFDSHTMSKANAIETCDRYRDAIFTPAVKALQKTQDNQADIDKKLPVWVKEFGQKWYPQCVDSACEHAIQGLIKSSQGEGQNLRDSHGAEGWIYVANALSSYNQSAATEIEASRTRSAATNKKMTAQASLGWADVYVGAWTPKCAEDACRQEIQALAKAMVAESNQRQAASPDESSGHVQGQVLRDYGFKAQKVVDESKRRAAILADPKAKATDKLPILTCKPFLGRAGEWFCESDQGFKACVGYVDGGSVTNCLGAQTKAQYAPFERVVSHLKNADCKQKGSREFECQEQKGLDTCGQYKAGGLQIICELPQAHKEAHAGVPSPHPVDNAHVATTGHSDGTTPVHGTVDVKAVLAKRGCKAFLGRNDEYLCSKGAAFDACEGFKKASEVKACHQSR